jgi:hypothetical protein
MKRIVIISLAVLLVIGMSFSITYADKPINKLSGAHYGFNIIGHPKNVDVLKNDNSNGRAIMVPLRNAKGPNAIVCEEEEVIITPDEEPTWTDQMPAGAKIHFVAGDDFEIIDRDATDNDGAEVMVPVDPDSAELLVDVWVRVLGKPNTCMDIDGYAYDNAQALWFWSGSVDLNRKHGKASWTDVRELFDVWFCQVEFVDTDGDGVADTEQCAEGTAEELSVFNNVFEDYFWNILNDGTRIVQVRLYLRD